MITLILLFLFFGSFALYNTSQKVVLRQNLSVEKWLQTNIRASKIIGVLLLLVSFFISIYYFGITSGILTWLFLLTTTFSLLIILYPLKKINFKYLSVLIIMLLVLELVII